MKKSNWIILGIAVLASVFLLWLWYFLKFNLIDDPLDLVLSIVWWAVVVIAVVGITWAEKRRQERIRTSYVAKGAVFNPEAGIVRVVPGTTATATVERILGNLTYSFDRQDPPEKTDLAFDYVVRTSKYKEPAAGSEANEPEWEGEVARANRPNEDPTPFASREELRAIIEDAAA